ncbi:MAG: GDSL-type esterase/lipase family protein [Candidatus Ornithomonoglobus sp.]
MKKIICFGDSNTYGHNPPDGTRMEKPWPAVLQELRPDCTVINEGMCSRTTHFPTPDSELHNGLVRFKELLNENEGAELLIIMLGTNDTLKFFNCSVSETVEALRGYIRSWREKFGQDSKILLISPILITNDKKNNAYFDDVYKTEAIGKSKMFGAAYKTLAEQEKVLYLNAARLCRTSSCDGIHMMPDEHAKLARAVYDVILNEI